MALMTRVRRVDATDADQLAAAEVEGRRQAHEYFRFLRECVPGLRARRARSRRARRSGCARADGSSASTSSPRTRSSRRRSSPTRSRAAARRSRSITAATTRAGSTSRTERPTGSRIARCNRRSSTTSSSRGAASRRPTTRMPPRARWARAWRWVRPPGRPPRCRRSRSASRRTCCARGYVRTAPMSVLERIRQERLVAIVRARRRCRRARRRAGRCGYRCDRDHARRPRRAGRDRACARARRRDGARRAPSAARSRSTSRSRRAPEAVVSPAFDRAVLERAAELGVPAIPGALTPTEVEAAWAAGAALVKLFPARPRRPALRARPARAARRRPAARDRRRRLRRTPRAFLAAGAVAVGVGSALDDPARRAASCRAAQRLRVRAWTTFTRFVPRRRRRRTRRSPRP